MKRVLFLVLVLAALTSLCLSSCKPCTSVGTPPSIDEGDRGDAGGIPDSEPEHLHSPAASVKENVIEPTCYAKGAYDEVICCSECGEEMSRERRESEQLKHEFTEGVCIHCDEPKFSEGLQIDYNGNGAYYLYGIGSCKDTDIVIPSRGPNGSPVTEIKPSAFKDCTEIVSVKIPDSVVSIESHAFEDCTGLRSIVIPDSVTSMSSLVFYGCTSLTDVKLGSGLTSIPSSAFSGCERLSSVSISEGVVTIEENAFSGCKALVSIELPSTLEILKDLAFHGCVSLESVRLSDSMTYLGENAFSDCYALTELSIPRGITTVEFALFFDCENLKSVTIPITVTSIEEHAFDGCDSLTSVFYEGTAEQWEDIAIYYRSNTALGQAQIYYNYTNKG